jgi:hypothetical protein
MIDELTGHEPALRVAPWRIVGKVAADLPIPAAKGKPGLDNQE